MAVEQQLSIEVGGEVGEFPIVSVFKLTGEVGATGQLYRDANVHVVVTDDDGEVVFSKYATVAGVSIVTKRKGRQRWTERIHKLSFDVDED